MKTTRKLSLFAVSDIIGLAIGTVMSPITTRLLTPAQYGAIPVVSAIWVMFAVFQFGTMDYSFPFFSSHSSKWGKGNVHLTSTRLSVIGASITWRMFGGWLIISGYGTQRAGLQAVEVVVYIVSLLPLILNGWQLYIMRYELMAVEFTKLTILGRVLPPIMSIPPILLVSQEDRLLVQLGFGCVANWIAYAWGARLLKGNRNDKESCVIDRRLAKEMLRYGLLLVPGGVIYSSFTAVDRFLLSSFRTAPEMAIFVLASSIGGIALIFKSWFSRVFDPLLVRWVAEKQPEQLKMKLQGTLNVLALGMSLIALMSLLWSKYIVRLLYPSEYQDAAFVIPVVVMAGVLSSLSLVFIAAPLIAQKAKYHIPVYTIGLIVNAIFGLVLIPPHGVAGAAWGTLFGEGAILFAWIFIGRYVLKNVSLRMGIAATMVTVSILCVLISSIAPITMSLKYTAILTLAVILIAVPLFFHIIRQNSWLQAIASSVRKKESKTSLH